MIKLTGTKKDGYVLSVQDKRYKDDIHITYEELAALQKILAKKLR